MSVVAADVVVSGGLGIFGQFLSGLTVVVAAGVDGQGTLAGGLGGVGLVDSGGAILGHRRKDVGRGHDLGQIGHARVDVGVEPRDSAAADESDLKLSVHVRVLPPVG